MTTSGNTIGQLTRDQIINGALRKLLVIGEGQTASATQLNTGAEALNSIVAEFRTLGMSIWARKQFVLPLVAGQKVYRFGVGEQVNIPYPLRIYVSNLQPTNPDYSQVIMNQMSFVDFDNLPNGSTGQPVNFSYQPKINYGLYSVWPTPTAYEQANSTIFLEYQSPFEYFVTGTDTPDFPEEWKNALVYTLALTLSDEYGVSTQKQQWLEKQSDKHVSIALSGGTEEASFFIQPDPMRDY